MLEHYGSFIGVKMARKHLGWYTKGLHGSAEFRNKVNFVDDPAAVQLMLHDFYTRLIDAEAGGIDIRRAA
jgi:tRNA-dihydrouridine synthase B